MLNAYMGELLNDYAEMKREGQRLIVDFLDPIDKPIVALLSKKMTIERKDSQSVGSSPNSSPHSELSKLKAMDGEMICYGLIF
jgi:hypothetical protein